MLPKYPPTFNTIMINLFASRYFAAKIHAPVCEKNRMTHSAHFCVNAVIDDVLLKVHQGVGQCSTAGGDIFEGGIFFEKKVRLSGWSQEIFSRFHENGACSHERETRVRSFLAISDSQRLGRFLPDRSKNRRHQGHSGTGRTFRNRAFSTPL